MCADVRALAMVFFNLVNPNQRYPYLAEIGKAKGSRRTDDIKVFVSELQRTAARPKMDAKYQKQFPFKCEATRTGKLHSNLQMSALYFGCLDVKPYLIDNHPISLDLGGDGGGVMRIYKDTTDVSWRSLCGWM